MTAALRSFLVTCEAMEDPAYELTVEDFAVFYVAFNRLRRGGVPFDDGFVARVEELHREAFHTADDGDHDDADEFIDLEDSDEDASPNATDE